MAKGDFYFPFLYQRFYSSTKGWSEEQEGAYLRLLTYQFDNGFIPNDMKVIKRISTKAFKNWSLFRSKFEQNSDGNFINLVMEQIRNDINKKKEVNKLNGKKGGDARSERLTERGSEKHTIPLTNNHNPIERVNALSPDLLNSNLYRQPVKPTKQQVLEAITNAGGTKEMAKSFWEKYEGTGWYQNNTPIMNYVSFAQKFVDTWKRNEKKEVVETPAIKYKNIT